MYCDVTRLSVDDTVLYTGPQAASWWEEGEFDTSFPGVDNPWAAGSSMAPFDHEVHMGTARCVH